MDVMRDGLLGLVAGLFSQAGSDLYHGRLSAAYDYVDEALDGLAAGIVAGVIERTVENEFLTAALAGLAEGFLSEAIHIVPPCYRSAADVQADT